MQNLIKYVIKHTSVGGDDGSDIDVSVEFFGVNIIEEPSEKALKQLIANSEGGDFLFDGNEHSYIEIGGWIGDQSIALQLMALGHKLGLWKLLTPSILLPSLEESLKRKMAESGMVTILAGNNKSADV